MYPKYRKRTPYRKRTNYRKRYYKKKAYTKRFNYKVQKLRVRQPYPLPDVMFTKFKYSENVQLNASTPGIPGEYLFRMNSLYDPNLSGPGHQPYLFDQLLTGSDGVGLYQRYTVFASKIKCTFYQAEAGTGSPTPVNVYIYPSNSQSAGLPTSWSDLDELRYIRRGQLAAAGGGEKIITTLKHYMKINKIEGYTKTEFQGHIADYSAYGANNPNRTPIWCVLVNPLFNQTGIVYCDVRITYYVRLDELSGNTPSS